MSQDQDDVVTRVITICETSKWSDCREPAVGLFRVSDEDASYPGELIALCESCAEHSQ